jgi:hypothetical protein
MTDNRNIYILKNILKKPEYWENSARKRAWESKASARKKENWKNRRKYMRNEKWGEKKNEKLREWPENDKKRRKKKNPETG